MMSCDSLTFHEKTTVFFLMMSSSLAKLRLGKALQLCFGCSHSYSYLVHPGLGNTRPSPRAATRPGSECSDLATPSLEVGRTAPL